VTERDRPGNLPVTSEPSPSGPGIRGTSEVARASRRLERAKTGRAVRESTGRSDMGGWDGERSKGSNM